MSEPRSIRDPIHGFIRLSGEEADIVATPVFQRLRGIRQLAFANLVYPGALHTRFEHTLGVFHVTSQLAKVCKLDDEHSRLVRLLLVNFHALGGESVHLYETRPRVGCGVRPSPAKSPILDIRLADPTPRAPGHSGITNLGHYRQTCFGGQNEKGPDSRPALLRAMPLLATRT